MARPKRNNEHAARILVTAKLLSARRAVSIFGTSLSRIHDYQKALETDKELETLYHRYLEEALSKSWAGELSITVTSILQRIRDNVESENKLDIQELDALIRAVGNLGDLDMTREHLLNVARETARGQSSSIQGQPDSLKDQPLAN